MTTTQGNCDMADSEQPTSDPASNKIEAMKSEPENIAPALTDPVSLEIADQLLVSIEMVDSHSDGSELAPSQSMISISDYQGLVYMDTLPDPDNAAIMVNSELTDVEATDTEQLHTENVGQQQFHSEAVSSEQLNGEVEPVSMDMHDEPSELVLAYSHSELVYSQPDGSELVDVQSYDHKEPSSMVNGETLHQKTEFVKMELVQPEMMHTDALGSPIDSDLVHTESPGLENMQLVSGDMVNMESQPIKGRKRKSPVWEHFKIETVSPGCRRARCNECGQSFAYSTGSKVVGTSHLKRHIAKGSCLRVTPLTQLEGNQLTLSLPKIAEANMVTTVIPHSRKRRYRSSSTPHLILDQDQCRHEIARMIIMHEYPLHMVEHPGLVSFVQHLQPMFDMVNFSTVQGDCVATYMREKKNLKNFIDGMPGRVSLTLDVWTSNQTTGYVFLYGQFIDHEWKLQRRLLNVVMEPFPESDMALSHAVATCLSYWNLNGKLHSITFSQPVTDAARENLRGLLSIKSPAIVNGQLLIGSCLARTLSGMALDALAVGQGALRKIRSSVKYVVTSYAHEEKFLELKQHLQIPSEKSLVLDNVTRWDSTYHMLVAACELQQVFSCLDALDPEYRDAPTMEDWKQAENVCVYLKLLLEMANLLVARSAPSTDVFFQEVWKIQMKLADDAPSEDPFVRNVVFSLQEKFNKYWRDSFVILAIAVAMDPRFKMKLVEFRLPQLFGEEAQTYIRMVEKGIHELFHEYAEDRAESESQQGSIVSSTGLSDFDRYMMETMSQLAYSELDQYLGESPLPRVQDFDLLGWWELNKVKYPALSKMALVVLSVPLSTVGRDHVFDTVGKEMDDARSSLKPETLEALTCTKDWLQYGRTEAVPMGR